MKVASMNNAPQLTYNAMPQELWSSDAAEPTPATGPYVGHDTGPLLDHPTVPSADVDSSNRSTFEGSRLDLPQTSTENHGWLPSVPTDDILPQTNFATTAGRPYRPPPSFASSANYQASSSVYGLQHSDLQATSHIAQQVFRDDPPSFQGREELRQIRGTLFVTAANNPYSGAGPGEGFFIADDDQADVSQTRWLVKDSRYDPNAYLHFQSRPGTVRGDTANAGTYQGPIPSEDWQNPQQLGPLASTSMSYYPGVDPTHRMRQARELRAPSGSTPTQWQVNQQFGSLDFESTRAASSRVMQGSSSAQVSQQTSGGYAGQRRAAEEDEKQDDSQLDVQQLNEPHMKERGGGRNRGGRGRRGSVARDSGEPSYSGESVFQVENYHWQP